MLLVSLHSVPRALDKRPCQGPEALLDSLVVSVNNNRHLAKLRLLPTRQPLGRHLHQLLVKHLHPHLASPRHRHKDQRSVRQAQSARRSKRVRLGNRHLDKAPLGKLHLQVLLRSASNPRPTTRLSASSPRKLHSLHLAKRHSQGSNRTPSAKHNNNPRRNRIPLVVALLLLHLPSGHLVSERNQLRRARLRLKIPLAKQHNPAPRLQPPSHPLVPQARPPLHRCSNNRLQAKQLATLTQRIVIRKGVQRNTKEKQASFWKRSTGEWDRWVNLTTTKTSH